MSTELAVGIAVGFFVALIQISRQLDAIKELLERMAPPDPDDADDI